MVSAKIILDSIPPAYFPQTRLTTMEVNIHRFVLAELNTHRVFSRNSASSRAIPIQKRIDEVRTNPALPLSWGKNQSGMSAAEELSPEDIEICKRHWINASENAIYTAQILSKLGLHKQVANRILEPFLWHKVIITSTEWDNFFSQRCHPAAQPEIRAAAEAMQKALKESAPAVRNWHLPYITPEEIEQETQSDCRKMSVARCARVSYLNHDGQYSKEKDLELYNKLISAKPPHLSPLEHVAYATNGDDRYPSNFDPAWAQLRGAKWLW